MKVTKMKHQKYAKENVPKAQKIRLILKMTVWQKFYSVNFQSLSLLAFFPPPLKKCFVLPLHIFLHYRNIYLISFRLDLIEFIKVQKCNNFFFLL